MPSYAAICFDLDSTLCEATQDGDALLERTFDRVGVEPFCTRDDFREAIPSLPTARTNREFYEYLFAEVAERADADPTLAPDLAGTYLQRLDPTAVEFRPGAEAALEFARERGPIGLVTNGGRETQTEKLESLGIAGAFDAAVFTDPTAGIHPKPDAAPFERALAELETTAAETLHVGDSLHADVAGANAMGMDSAWIDLGVEKSAETEPTHTLESLAELPDRCRT